MILRSLRGLLETSEQILWDMVRKTWIATPELDPHGNEAPILYYLEQIASKDESAAQRIVGLPFLNTLEVNDVPTMKFMHWLLDFDHEGLQQLLDDPRIGDAAAPPLDRPVPLLFLDMKAPNAAAVIDSLSWVADGMTDFELDTVVPLLNLALKSEAVFQGVLDKERPWASPAGGIEGSMLLDLLASMSAVDEETVLRIIEMPFLETFEFSDADAVAYMERLMKSDLAQLQELLSDPRIRDGITDDTVYIVPLLYLRFEYPDAAAAIENLAWVRDGVAYVEPSEYEGVASFEQGLFFDLVRLAEERPQFFMALVDKSWVQDQLTPTRFQVLEDILDLASHDEALASRIVTMSFLDAADMADMLILEALDSLSRYDYEGAHWVVSHPTLSGDIANDDAGEVVLLRLEWLDPEASATLREFAWISDGVSPSEMSTLWVLVGMSLDSPQSLQALVRRPWARDDLNLSEGIVLEALSNLSGSPAAQQDEGVTARIIGMPFLDSVEGADAAAAESLSVLAENLSTGSDYLSQVLSHPTLSGGITDGTAKLVAVLRYAVGDYALREHPDMLETLLASDLASFQEKAITLPHSGEVSLSVIHIGPGSPRSMDLLEHSVRSQEEFLEQGFPRSYVSLLVADVSPYSGGGGPSGIVTVDPGMDEDTGLIAHELAHTYWYSSPLWIREGAAELMRVVSEGKLSDPILRMSPDTSCYLAQSIGELDRLAFERTLDIQDGPEDEIYASSCMYTMGLGLLMDLYDGLGDEIFRNRFQSLYLKMRDGKHDDECTGIERGLCYMREAFVIGSSGEAASEADAIISRWYHGNPQVATQ